MRVLDVVILVEDVLRDRCRVYLVGDLHVHKQGGLSFLIDQKPIEHAATGASAAFVPEGDDLAFPAKPFFQKTEALKFQREGFRQALAADVIFGERRDLMLGVRLSTKFSGCFRFPVIGFNDHDRIAFVEDQPMAK